MSFKYLNKYSYIQALCAILLALPIALYAGGLTNVKSEPTLTVTLPEVIIVNKDDVNGNDVWDKDEGGDNATTVAKLVKVTVAVGDTPDYTKSADLSASGGSYKLWKDNLKSAEFVPGSVKINETLDFYVEGLKETDLATDFVVRLDWSEGQASLSKEAKAGIWDVDLVVGDTAKLSSDEIVQKDKVENSSKPENPGVIVLKNNGFADGLGIAGAEAQSKATLVPITVKFNGQFDPATAELTIDYGSASIPRLDSDDGGSIHQDKNASGAPVFTLNAGGLRLWKTSGPEHDGHGVNDKVAPGDFIPSGDSIEWKTLSSQSTMTLYAEYVDTEGAGAAGQRSINLAAKTSISVSDPNSSAGTSTSAEVTSTDVAKVFLLPVELIDTKDKVLDDQAPQGTTITAAMRDVNIEQKATVNEQKERSIAWIEPHGADDASNAPDMPQLMLRFRGTEQMGLKIKWKLEVIYNRPRGTNPDVTQMTAQDEVFVPKKASGSQPWKEEALDGVLEIFNHPDWIAALQDKGFFGGEAKLIYQLLKSDGSALGTESTMLFSIGGRNPEDNLAKAYIDTKATAADSRLTRLSYATGRHESKDYNGGGSRYNQFWEGYARRYRIDHRRGDPLWCKSPDEESAGGFGIFQITGNLSSQFAVIPREQMWNWQKNVDAYVTIVKTGGSAAKGSAMDRFIAAVARTYPSDNEAQTSPTSFSYDGGSYDAWEMGSITLYNGAGGCPQSKLKNSAGKWSTLTNPWKYDGSGAAGSRWRYNQNSNNYLHEVIQEK